MSLLISLQEKTISDEVAPDPGLSRPMVSWERDRR